LVIFFRVEIKLVFISVDMYVTSSCTAIELPLRRTLVRSEQHSTKNTKTGNAMHQ